MEKWKFREIFNLSKFSIYNFINNQQRYTIDGIYFLEHILFCHIEIFILFCCTSSYDYLTGVMNESSMVWLC